VSSFLKVIASKIDQSQQKPNEQRHISPQSKRPANFAEQQDNLITPTRDETGPTRGHQDADLAGVYANHHGLELITDEFADHDTEHHDQLMQRQYFEGRPIPASTSSLAATATSTNSHASTASGHYLIVRNDPTSNSATKRREMSRDAVRELTSKLWQLANDMDGGRAGSFDHTLDHDFHGGEENLSKLTHDPEHDLVADGDNDNLPQFADLQHPLSTGNLPAVTGLTNTNVLAVAPTNLNASSDLVLSELFHLIKQQQDEISKLRDFQIQLLTQSLVAPNPKNIANAIKALTGTGNDHGFSSEENTPVFDETGEERGEKQALNGEEEGVEGDHSEDAKVGKAESNDGSNLLRNSGLRDNSSSLRANDSLKSPKSASLSNSLTSNSSQKPLNTSLASSGGKMPLKHGDNDNGKEGKSRLFEEEGMGDAEGEEGEEGSIKDLDLDQISEDLLAALTTPSNNSPIPQSNSSLQPAQQHHQQQSASTQAQLDTLNLDQLKVLLALLKEKKDNLITQVSHHNSGELRNSRGNQSNQQNPNTPKLEPSYFEVSFLCPFPLSSASFSLLSLSAVGGNHSSETSSYYEAHVKVIRSLC
jgi:hypothetical protein